MFRCHVCGSTHSQDAMTDELFEVDGKHVLVEGIPTIVCVACGEKTFSRGTTERIRRMVHGEAEPSRSVSMAVFSFA